MLQPVFGVVFHVLHNNSGGQLSSRSTRQNNCCPIVFKGETGSEQYDSIFVFTVSSSSRLSVFVLSVFICLSVVVAQGLNEH